MYSDFLFFFIPIPCKYVQIWNIKKKKKLKKAWKTEAFCVLFAFPNSQ